MADEKDSASCPTCGAMDPMPRSGPLAGNALYIQGKKAVLKSDRWHHTIKEVGFLCLGLGMWSADVLDNVMRFLCQTSDSMINVVYNWTLGWIWGRRPDTLSNIYGWYNVLSFVVAGYLVFRVARWYFWTRTVERIEGRRGFEAEKLVPLLLVAWFAEYIAVTIPGNWLLSWIWSGDLPRFPSLLGLVTFAIGAGTIWYMHLSTRNSTDS